MEVIEHKKYNTKTILKQIYDMLENYKHPYIVELIAEKLNIENWNRRTLAKKDLMIIKSFLEIAIANGFYAYVLFTNDRIIVFKNYDSNSDFICRSFGKNFCYYDARINEDYLTDKLEMKYDEIGDIRTFKRLLTENTDIKVA